MSIALKLATVETPEAWDAASAQPLVYARAGFPSAPRRTWFRRVVGFFGRCIRPLLFLVKMTLRLALVLVAVSLIVVAGLLRFALVTLAHALLALPKIFSVLTPRLAALRRGGRVPYARLA